MFSARLPRLLQNGFSAGWDSMRRAKTRLTRGRKFIYDFLMSIMPALPVRFALLLAACVAAGEARGEEESPLTRLFDTGVSLPAPISEQVVARITGWSQVPEDKTNHQFTGEAVLLNDKDVGVR